MLSVADFNSLVVGLRLCVKGDSDTSFRWGCHRLAFFMAQRYPRTQEGLLSLLRTPLKDWYPGEIPSRFDSSYSLLTQDDLSREAENYYLELSPDDLSNDVLEQRLAIENDLFRQLYLDLKNAYKKGDAITKEGLQAEYVSLRRFLIEHPYTTTKELKRTFRQGRYAKASRVGDLYRSLSPTEMQKPAWICARCGPLMVEYGQLKSIKPEVCGDHREDMDWVHKVKLDQNSRQLCMGVHLSVLIPGVPELALFQMLEEIRKTGLPGVEVVTLYPEIDCYDLRLQFCDRTIWAIDVKDSPDSSSLAGNLKPLVRSGSLKYDEGIYVVPQAYVNRNPEYIAQARASNEMRDMQLMGSDTFENKVKAKVKQLVRAQKK